MDAADQSGHPLETCPKADQVPPPLMEEYLALVKEPNVQVTNPYAGILAPGQDKSGLDHYKLSLGEKSMNVHVTPGHGVADQSAVRWLDRWDEGKHRRFDEYTGGVRTRAEFSIDDPRTGHSVITQNSKFGDEAGKHYLAEENGMIYDKQVNEIGFFSAKFDSNGKLTDYRMRPFRMYIEITHCFE